MSDLTCVNVNIEGVSILQQNVMAFIQHWVKERKIPTPHKDILVEMKKKGVKGYTATHALNALIKKGYIRRAYTMSNKTSYVQIRSL